MRQAAYHEQEVELLNNFNQLSLEGRAKVAMFSRELVEEEEAAADFKQFAELLNGLNEEELGIALAYLDALTANPKYRRSSATARCGRR